MRQLVVSVLLAFALAALPAVSEATTSFWVSIDEQPVTTVVRGGVPFLIDSPEIQRVVSFNGLPSIIVSGTYASAGRTFLVNRCFLNVNGVSQPCAGPPRLVVQDTRNSFSEVSLTDARVIRTDANGGVSSLVFHFTSDDFAAIDAGKYKYYIHQDGRFLGDTLQNIARNDTFEGSGFFDGSLPEGECSTPIPPDDVILTGAITAVAQTAATTQINVSTTGFPCCVGPYSMFTPYYNFTAGSATSTSSAFLDFTGLQEAVDGCCDDGEGSCGNVLDGEVRIRLFSPPLGARRHSVNLPGSFSVGVVNVPADEGGDQILAERLASLDHLRRGGGRGDGSAVVLKACLTPSPGAPTRLEIRDVSNSSTAWLSSGCNFSGTDGVRGDGETEVEITRGGTVRVTAHGLCPVDGCEARNVGISLFCGGDNPDPETPVSDSVNALALDKNGNGQAVIAASLPCFDPAVLIRELPDLDGIRRWIAASGLH